MSGLAQFQHDADKVDLALEVIHKKALEAKRMIEELVMMLNLEDKVHWPDMLEKFTSLAALMSTLQVALRRNALPSGEENSGQLLRSNVFVPLRLQYEPDPKVEELTQARLTAWHHDVVPDYLRTKLNPEIETEEALIEQERSGKTQEYIQRQVQNLNKHVDLLLQNFANYDRAQTEQIIEKPTYSDAETQKLVRTVMCGEELRAPRPTSSNPSATAATTQQGMGPGSVPPQQSSIGMGGRGGGPSSTSKATAMVGSSSGGQQGRPATPQQVGQGPGSVGSGQTR